MGFRILIILLLPVCSFGQDENPIANHPDNDSCTIIASTAGSYSNVITPDSEDFHGFGFISKGNCSFESYSFIIFNRWGEIVFEAAEPNKLWFGNDENGNTLQDDTYIWQVKYQIEDEEKVQHRGHITMIK